MLATPAPPIGSGSSGEMGGMKPPVMVRPAMVALVKLANTRVMPVPSITVCRAPRPVMVTGRSSLRAPRPRSKSVSGSSAGKRGGMVSR